MPTVQDVATFLDDFAPSALAAEWDNVGLLLGERDALVDRVMTCLTVTPESAGEAITAGARLIVTHHPIFFRGIKRLTDVNPEGRMLLHLARAGVAVYSPHTAFDNTPGGINDLLSSRLGLTSVAPLRALEPAAQYKLVVFVPDNDLSRVADALFAAGAGRIGQYRECSFRLPGTGTFFGSGATNPTVGQKGRREEVAEWRLEVICPSDKLSAVTAALRQAHSYEEPAFDVYLLKGLPGPGGEGRIGVLPAPVTLGTLAERVRGTLGSGPVQVVGDLGKEIRTMAIAYGAAGEMLADSLRRRADVFLTGEMRFHDYLAAQAAGIGLVLPGHYATERLGAEELARQIGTRFQDVEAWASRRERDPVQWK
jgi:dinuclear metal center YbgI/SA1388 family protein